jgi:arylsulfatase A-like enzyme
VCTTDIVVFASDHGEGHGDHGEQTHSMLLYDTTIRVPLVIRVPGGVAGQVVEDRVGLVDITPTILNLLDVSPPGDLDGRSLVPFLRSDEPPSPAARHEIYVETLSPRLVNGWGAARNHERRLEDTFMGRARSCST